MAYPVAGTPVATTFGSVVTSCAVNMPASVSAGDLLLAFVETRYVETWTLPSSWTQLFQQTGGSSVGQLSVFYLKAAGTEGGTTPTWTCGTSTTASWQVIDVTGWDGTTTPAYSTGSGDSTTNPSSPALTPSGGSAPYLWLAIVGDAATGSAFTSAPSGYSGFTNTSASSGGAATELATSYLQATSSTETPGVWGYGSNRYWAAATIAIKPTLTAYSYISASSAQGTSTTSPLNVVYAATPTAGNLLIASVERNVLNGSGTYTVSDLTNGNWTKANFGNAGTGNTSTAHFIMIAASSQPTTITLTSSTGTAFHMSLYEFSGNPSSLSGIVDVSGNGPSTVAALTTSTTAPSLTTTNAGDLIFSSVCTLSAFTAPSWTGATILQQNPSGGPVLVDGYQLETATGTYQPYLTWTTNTRNYGQATTAFFPAGNVSTVNSNFLMFF